MIWITQYGPWIIGTAIVVGGAVWKLDRTPILAWWRKTVPAQERAALASDLAIIRPLAEAAVPYIEQVYGTLPGAQKFTQAVEHVITALGHRGLVGDPTVIRAAVQKAFGVAKTNGTLAASTPKAAAVPPATPS
jgi:hypothetical protein